LLLQHPVLHMHAQETPSTNSRDLLLAEVNFKWLMSGLGWWVDMSRFHTDTHYADHFLMLGSSAESVALRECAALLRSQSEGQRQLGSASAHEHFRQNRALP